MRRSRKTGAVPGAHPAAERLPHAEEKAKEAVFLAPEEQKLKPGQFANPFSGAYWRQAAREMKSTKMLVFAALMIALRLAMKQLSIPIAADLKINTAFVVNALGAAVMGPVLSAFCAAITDVLGYLIKPEGVYFPPFILTEIAGSVIFALFLYRADITPKRVIASRFCVNFFVNIVLTTPIMMMYYEMIMGRYYAPFDLLRIVKNLALFPLESLLLIVLLRYMIPVFRRMGYAIWAGEELRLGRKAAALLAALTVIGSLCVGGYVWLNYENTSLSASYSAQERYERNVEVGGTVLERHPEIEAETAVCVIESAYPKAFSDRVVYTVAVYRADIPAEEDAETLLASLRGLSKSKAAASPYLTRALTAEAVYEGGSWTVTDLDPNRK